ncbi:MAG: glycosyltransferase [Actinomycetota bacterium]|nr:glycosyltransferase [Actinomycetota bacterium]
MEGRELVPVVAVLATHQSGDDVARSLAALRQQTYGSLRILIACGSADLERVRDLVAQDGTLSEVVCEVVGGSLPDVANEATGLVEGDNGLFWFIEGGTSPEPDALERLVDELLQSNAGIVGPKIVHLEERSRVQAVGIAVDRLGERAGPLDLDEIDQEQHDRVRDVLAVDASGMLVRADLFRRLGGFAPGLTHGTADIDLCWRAHYAGARVVVVPDAVIARPQSFVLNLVEERQRGQAQFACDQLDAALVAVTARQFPVRVLQTFAVSVLQIVLGIFLGAARQPARRLRALMTLPLRLSSLRERRRQMEAIRLVSDADVSPFLQPISNRLLSSLRSHDADVVVTSGAPVIRQRERTYGPTLAWFLIVLGILIGSREFIRSGVPGVGAWLPVDLSTGELLARWWSPWDARGVGSTLGSAGGFVVLAALHAVPLVGSLLTGWGLGVGAVICGLIGIQRISDVYPTTRPRVVALIVYAAGPVVPAVLGAGDVEALTVYAVLPWIVHLARRLAGIVAADSSTVEGDLVDGVLVVQPAQRRRLVSAIVLISAAGGSIAPVVIPVAVATLVLLAFSSWLMRSESVVVTRFLTAAGAAAVSYLLLLPSSLGWRWSTLNGGELAGVAAENARNAATFGGDAGVGLLGAALLVPLAAALLITRAWRLTWAVRGASLVLVGMASLVFAGRGVATAYLPTASVLSVVMLFGATFPAAGIAGGFRSDVLDRSFGWRQPLALIAHIAIVLGVVPGVLSVGAGDWNAAEYPISSVVASQFPSNPATGPYRVLWVGDPRVLPMRGHQFEPGVAFVITDSGGLEIGDSFPRAEGDVADAVREALSSLADGSTSRVGRLLGPLGIRFIAVPVADGVASTLDDPIAPPAGLTEVLAAQLDVGVVQSPPTLEVFVNRSWIPPAAFLTGGAEIASRNAGIESLLLADLDGISSVALSGEDGEEFVDAVIANGTQSLAVPSAGVLHLGVPFDRHWQVETADGFIAPRAGFGQTVAFDIPVGGEIAVSYDTPLSAYFVKAVIALAWIAMLLAATRPERRQRLSRVSQNQPVMAFGVSDEQEVDE